MTAATEQATAEEPGIRSRRFSLRKANIARRIPMPSATVPSLLVDINSANRIGLFENGEGPRSEDRGPQPLLTLSQINHCLYLADTEVADTSREGTSAVGDCRIRCQVRNYC